MLTLLLGGAKPGGRRRDHSPLLLVLLPNKVMGPRAALRRLWASIAYGWWLRGIFVYTPITARIKSQRTFNKTNLQFGVVLFVDG